MNRKADTRKPLDVTRDRYDSAARLLKLIAAHVDRKLTNTRPALNVRHDWTDVGDAERLMNEVWDVAARLYLNETGGDEPAARAMARQAAFDGVLESKCVKCGLSEQACALSMLAGNVSPHYFNQSGDHTTSCPDNCGHVACQTGRQDRRVKCSTTLLPVADCPHCID